MRAARLAFISVFALAFSSCAHVYHAPNNARLEASTKRLSNAVTKATTTAERAKSHVEAAQKAADKEAVASATVLTKMKDLVNKLPPELKAEGEALLKAEDEDQSAIGDIVTNVGAARSDHVELEKDLAEAKKADVQVHVDKQEYYVQADKLAAVATKQSKDLAWYRWHWWGSWVALGAGVIACIIFAFLKFTGRLTFSAAKVAAKL